MRELRKGFHPFSYYLLCTCCVYLELHQMLEKQGNKRDTPPTFTYSVRLGEHMLKK